MITAEPVPAAGPVAGPDTGPVGGAELTRPAAAPVPLTRLLVEVAAVEPPATRDPAEALAGRQFVVVDDGLGVAVALAAALEAQGAEVRTVHPDRLADAAGCDGVVDLSALRPAPAPVLPEGFRALRDTLVAGTRQLLLVTGCGGAFGRGAPPADADDGLLSQAMPEATDPIPGAGLYGFARSAAIEYPGAEIRAVDIDPKDRPERIASHLIAELCSPDEPVAVGYTNGTRNVLRTVPVPLPGGGRLPLSLSRDSVVLLTGGPAGSPPAPPSAWRTPPAATSNSSAVRHRPTTWRIRHSPTPLTGSRCVRRSSTRDCVRPPTSKRPQPGSSPHGRSGPPWTP